MVYLITMKIVFVPLYMRFVIFTYMVWFCGTFLVISLTSYLPGRLRDMLLQVILIALTSLKAHDHDLQRSGVTILAGLAEHSKPETLHIVIQWQYFP